MPHPPSGPPRSDAAAAPTSSWKRTRLRALLRAASSSSSPDTSVELWATDAAMKPLTTVRGMGNRGGMNVSLMRGHKAYAKLSNFHT